MSARKTIVGICALCAIAVAGLGAQSAFAQQAYTCANTGSGDFLELAAIQMVDSSVCRLQIAARIAHSGAFLQRFVADCRPRCQRREDLRGEAGRYCQTEHGCSTKENR